MPRETDLLRVKLVAHTLLDVQIQETALSPVIVSHPFTTPGSPHFGMRMGASPWST